MRLGLLADIHEDVAMLEAALSALHREGADQLAVPGDVFEHGRRIGETAAILAASGAVGVWGNHDVGLCHEVDDWIRARFDPPVLDYFATLRPSLTIGDCHVSHVQPRLDPRVPTDFYETGGRPTTPEQAARCLAARPERFLLMGHYHRWSIADRRGPCAWDWISPFRFGPGGRYVIVCGAVMDGRCGILDDERGVLVPLDLRDGASAVG
jgi:predicted phosphodiesterase